MAVNLLPHQERALKELKTGSILRGGLGSGKSITALAYFYTKECGGRLPAKDNEQYPEMKSPKDLYIITTPKKRDGLEWEDECRAFLLSTEPAVSPCRVTIDSWNNIGKYLTVKDAFFIFDEQRAIGSGPWAKGFVKITKSNNWIMLSATPGDVWLDYIPVFLAHGFYKTKTEFINTHVVYSRHVEFPKVERYLGTAKLNKLKESITVYMDLERFAVPHHEWIRVDYSEEDYKRVWKDRWDIFEDKPIKNHSGACYLARKVVNSHPGRIEKLQELFLKHSKMIVFYNFNYELDALIDYAEKMGIPYSQWNGRKHESLLIGEKWLYFVQYTAGAEGWNCITTDTVVFYSQNYSYRAVTQAAGRIDRLNTPYKDLYYYHLYSRAPIDQGIQMAYNKKKTFNEKKFMNNSERERVIRMKAS